jgi:hypothetical protein
MTHGHEDFDPELARLFEEARRPLAEDAFVSLMLARMQLAHRARLLRQVVTLLAVMMLGGLIAPYAARETVATVGWIGESLSMLGGALTSPIGWACSLLIAWRIVRRALPFGR